MEDLNFCFSLANKPISWPFLKDSISIVQRNHDAKRWIGSAAFLVSWFPFLVCSVGIFLTRKRLFDRLMVCRCLIRFCCFRQATASLISGCSVITAIFDLLLLWLFITFHRICSFSFSSTTIKRGRVVRNCCFVRA